MNQQREVSDAELDSEWVGVAAVIRSMFVFLKPTEVSESRIKAPAASVNFACGGSSAEDAVGRTRSPGHLDRRV